MTEQIHVSEPWLSHIIAGRKTVEGKKGTAAEWARLLNTTVIFHGDNMECSRVVVAIRWYPKLEEYLAAEWQRAAPHAVSLEDAAQKYAAVINPQTGEAVFAPGTVIARGGICGLELGE